MPFSKRPYRRIALAVAPIVMAMALWALGERGRVPEPIDPSGGAPAARFAISRHPIYLQKDPEWANEPIGGSNEPLAAVGCVVCSVSMGIAEFGVDIRPDSLTRLLRRHQGFTDRGWLVWDRVFDVTDGRITVDTPNRISHQLIDAALQRGRPVVARILLRDYIQHWVLIVGKDGREYLVKDPLGTGSDLRRLSTYDSQIYSVRVIRHSADDR